MIDLVEEKQRCVLDDSDRVTRYPVNEKVSSSQLLPHTYTYVYEATENGRYPIYKYPMASEK